MAGLLKLQQGGGGNDRYRERLAFAGRGGLMLARFAPVEPRANVDAYLAASLATNAACSGEARPRRTTAKTRFMSRSSKASASSQSPGKMSER
jgi:hypothetical protein